MNKSYYVSEGRTIVVDQAGKSIERNNRLEFKRILTVENTLEKMNEYYDNINSEIDTKNETKTNILITTLGLCTFLTLGCFASQKMSVEGFRNFTLLEASLIPLAISAMSFYTVNGIKKEEVNLKNKLVLIRDELIKLQNEWFSLNSTPIVMPTRDAMPIHIDNDEAYHLISNIENTVLSKSFEKKLTFKKKQLD